MSSPATENRRKLITILQLAYSAELAAAYAYRGHWHSVSDLEERREIKKIEDDELRHRRLVGEMLTSLASVPNKRREVRAAIIGRVLAFLCHITGWLAPMYGAGRLESGNIKEYESAARYARDCGRADLIDCLLEMAEVEWDHEYYFRSQVQKHRIGRKLPLWPVPPLKPNIRSSFERERIAESHTSPSVLPQEQQAPI